jgi:hypothetical protein
LHTGQCRDNGLFLPHTGQTFESARIFNINYIFTGGDEFMAGYKHPCRYCDKLIPADSNVCPVSKFKMKKEK